MALTELQEKLLPLIKAFHGICVEHDLRYYLIGGTALGAARHGGFIPWDDDIDVGMPRVDYEKLKELAPSLELGDYRIEYPSEDKSFVYPYGKMYDTTTTLVENTRYKTRRGIYIDIFPLDGAGQSKEEALQNFREIDKKVNLLSTKTCAWRKGRKLHKNLALMAMRCVPEFIVSQTKLKAEIDAMSKKLAFDDSAYVANFVGNWHEKEIYKREWLGTPVEVEFEGIKLYGPAMMDEYLTAMYGDWRTPPPPEKQITHHDYLEIDLEKSY